MQRLRVVDQLLDASLRHAFIRRIEQYELIGMHGYPHVVVLDECADPAEIFQEEILPVEAAYGMGGEGDQIRGYPEEKDMVFGVEPEHLEQALEVVADGVYQALLRVGFEAEGTIAPAPDGAVDAGIAYLHGAIGRQHQT